MILSLDVFVGNLMFLQGLRFFAQAPFPGGSLQPIGRLNLSQLVTRLANRSMYAFPSKTGLTLLRMCIERCLQNWIGLQRFFGPSKRRSCLQPGHNPMPRNAHASSGVSCFGLQKWYGLARGFSVQKCLLEIDQRECSNMPCFTAQSSGISKVPPCFEPTCFSLQPLPGSSGYASPCSHGLLFVHLHPCFGE